MFSVEGFVCGKNSLPFESGVLWVKIVHDKCLGQVPQQGSKTELGGIDCNLETGLDFIVELRRTWRLSHLFLHAGTSLIPPFTLGSLVPQLIYLGIKILSQSSYFLFWGTALVSSSSNLISWLKSLQISADYYLLFVSVSDKLCYKLHLSFLGFCFQITQGPCLFFSGLFSRS